MHLQCLKTGGKDHTHKTHTVSVAPPPLSHWAMANLTGLCNFRGSLIVTSPHIMRKLCHDESD